MDSRSNAGQIDGSSSSSSSNDEVPNATLRVSDRRSGGSAKNVVPTSEAAEAEAGKGAEAEVEAQRLREAGPTVENLNEDSEEGLESILFVCE